MFNAAPSLKTQPPSRTPPGTVKPLSKPTDTGGATLVFGASPGAAHEPKVPAKIDASANATILFGKAQSAVVRPPAAQVPTPPPQKPPPPMRAADLARAGAPATQASAEDEPGAAEPAGEIRDAGGEQAAAGASAAEDDLAAGQAAASEESEAAASESTGHPARW